MVCSTWRTTKQFHAQNYIVSQKTKQICICQNFVKFLPILMIFGRKMAKRLKLWEVHSFFISPNLCHNTTMWNAYVPNCHTTLKVVSCKNFLTTKLAQNKPKYAKFSRIVRLCYSSVQNCQNLCSKCAPRTRTQALRRRRHWLIVASTIDWSNCAHSSIRRVLSSSTSVILQRIFVKYARSKNRMVPKISNFHYLGLKELKCAVVCYFQGFYSVVWQFGTSAFHMVVLWHKLGEVENECTSHNFNLLAIFLPKIIKFGGNLTKFWQIQICLVFLRHGV